MVHICRSGIHIFIGNISIGNMMLKLVKNEEKVEKPGQAMFQIIT